MIPDPGSRLRMTLSLQSISTIPFEAGASNIKIADWGQHISNCRMPCLLIIFCTFWVIRDQPNKNLEMHLRCGVDVVSNITNCEIQWLAMLVAQKFGQVGHVGCTYDQYNCHSSRKLSLQIPPPVTCYHLAVYSATFQVCKVTRSILRCA